MTCAENATAVGITLDKISAWLFRYDKAAVIIIDAAYFIKTCFNFLSRIAPRV